MKLENIQKALQEEGIAGWLFCDFRGNNTIAYQVLGLNAKAFYTRRWFYFVPARGMPVALVSAVESHVLRTLPGEQRIFQTWRELHDELKNILPAGQKVAMEYSPMNAIPYIAKVDAGTVELIRSFGVEVVSSANISQRFVAELTEKQIESHRRAGAMLIAAKDRLFAALRADLKAGLTLDEYSVQQRFARFMHDAGIDVEEPPIVAVNSNASNPHYLPTESTYSPIKPGDLVLFDFWGKVAEPDAIYADYTWMAFVGTANEIPEKQLEVFDVVKRARDTAIAFVRTELAAGRRVEGWRVDDVSRGVIEKAGYGRYFVHRTGHNIGTFEHGNGANIDNFETRDERFLLPDTCCSIEPGVYLPEFGVRSEVDLLIHTDDVEVTGSPQTEIVPLM
ncbi:MAG TPA: M24 family metallopeptidase [Ktedonobacteraceae bacterium]|nr:M24 family metallopeptidase [Ktedonobacteraceae bacterium]